MSRQTYDIDKKRPKIFMEQGISLVTVPVLYILHTTEQIVAHLALVPCSVYLHTFQLGDIHIFLAYIDTGSRRKGYVSF